MPSFTLGTDPEFFIRYGGEVKPVVGLVGGTKENPKPMGPFFVQEDNCALELNTPPAHSEQEWVFLVTEALNTVKREYPEIELVSHSVWEFTPSQIMAGGRQARRFGCDPDFDAWTGKVNPIPRPPSVGFRSAAGHVHIGINGVDVRKLVKKLDLFLATPGMLMGDDLSRRRLYGKAGAHRPKMYGVEYRVLSNFWVFDPKLISWVWRQVERAIHADIDIDKEERSIIRAVNEGDLAEIDRLVSKYNLEVL